MDLALSEFPELRVEVVDGNEELLALLILAYRQSIHPVSLGFADC